MHSEDLPSLRAFLVLLFIELILAGILSTVGLLTAWLFVVLGGGGLLALWLWDKRKRKLFWLVVVACLLAVILAGVWKEFYSTAVPPVAAPQVTSPKPPDKSTVSPVLAIRGVRGDDLEGNILIKNDSNQAITVLAYRYDAFGGNISSSGLSRTLGAFQALPINLEDGNKLVKNGRLTFRYDFKFVGFDETYKGFGDFIIPRRPKIGEEISPDECCFAKEAPNLAVDVVQTAEEQLKQPVGHFGLPFYDENGVVKIGAAPSQLIYFDPNERTVLFLSGPIGKQVVRVSGMARNPHGEHWVEVLWDAKKGVFEMSTDGHPARHVSQKELGKTAVQ